MGNGFIISGLIEFGRYYIDDNTMKDAVHWLVLAKENNRMLLIADKAVDSRPYHCCHDCISWDTCSLRSWLNKDFIESCFDPGEQSRILTTETSGGAADKVFLLSTDEAENYFGSAENRSCIPTGYAQKRGAWVNNGLCYWWLRSQGGYADSAAFVDYNGEIIRRGDSVNDIRAAVRPALWLAV